MTSERGESDPTRHDLRRNLRASRRELSAADQARASTEIHRYLIGSGLLSPGDTVAGYLATDGEPSVTSVLDHARAGGSRVVLPVVESGGMVFRVWSTDADLVAGPVGLTQPAASAPEVVIDEIDVVLVPAVAVDRSGTRLGRGAGYYDRACAGRVTPGQPLLVAVVHVFQVVDALEAQPWDVPVDAVVTDDGWWWAAGRERH